MKRTVKPAVAASRPASRPVRRRADEKAVPKASFPVVGIGASAGGVEAITQMLRHLPQDLGMAFVVVQHLDPTHESRLAELLSRATRMPVSQIRDGVPVRPNQIYVIPPNANLSIQKDILRLVESTASGIRMPVDYFLRSLAQDRQDKAIGVILSGTASDGSLGLKAIKAEGGITFAQDNESAQYDGMPRSAVTAGAVDFILPPKEIATELSEIARHLYLSEPLLARLPGPDGGDLKKIFSLLLAVTEVDFSEYKPTTIKRRIKRRMVVHRMDRLKSYAAFLQRNPPEIQALYQDLLINVTRFFRDPGTFRHLMRRIFPEILKHRSDGQSIRVWVPGCSTGEEAYSLAMALSEFLEGSARDAPIQIFATDISDSAIEKARAGIYPANISLDVSSERLHRFFCRVDGGYQIASSIRDLCVFARQNLVGDPPFSGLDLISCRNLLIYLGPALQKRVMPIFHYALKPDGFLLLGPAETVGAFGEMFALVDRANRIYTRRPIPWRSVLDIGSRGRKPARGDLGRHLPVGVSVPLELAREADRAIQRHFAPPGVLINEAMEICQFRGETGLYLGPAPGRASLSLMKLARQSLLPGLHTAVSKAKRDGIAVQARCGRLRVGGESVEVFVSVIPVNARGSQERNFLVLFQDEAQISPGESAARETRETNRAPDSPAGRRRLARLTEELTATEDYLRTIVEEQEAGNEELRSANEEILSSNEELQSMNEELETTQEELQTSNEELQSLNLRLSQSKDDLTNLLRSASIPIVMVDRDLHIRMFTPTAAQLFHLGPTDEGRTLGELGLEVEVPNLSQQISGVIGGGGSEERDVRGPGGRWYAMRIHPYRTAENKVGGAVLALVDIDDLKRSAQELKESHDFSDAIIDTVHLPLVVLDPELRVRRANRAFCDFLEVDPAEVLGVRIQEIGAVRWASRLQGHLEMVLAQNTRLHDLEYDAEFPRTGLRTMLFNACRLDGGGERARMILLAIRDITDRRRAERRVMVNYAVARVLAEAPNLTVAIPQILQAICESLGWDLGEVWQVDEEANLLRRVAEWHRAGGRLGEFGETSKEMTFHPDVGMAGRVWSSRRPFWVPNIATEDNILRGDLRQQMGLHSAMAFPILLGEEVLGILEFLSHRILEPDETLLQMMATIGSQIGQFIERKGAEHDLVQAHAKLEARIAERTAQLSNTNKALEEEIVERKQVEESLRQLSTRLLRVQDEERHRLARELHDSTAQSLAALSMNLAVANECRAALHERARIALDESAALTERCSKEIRSLSYLLHPPLLEEVGLPSALRWCAEGFGRRSGISVDLDLPAEFGRLPVEMENALFRVVQECLTNIHRHSGSASAWIRLVRNPGEVILEVRDEGHGLPEEVLRKHGGVEFLGVGLLGMRERIRQLGGRMQIDSGEGGATIRVELPMAADGV